MQKTYRRTFARMALGTIEGLGMPRVQSYENSGGSTYETYTLALPASPDNSTAYGVSATPPVGSAIPVSFTTDGSATRAELAAGLLAAIRASALYDHFVPTLNVAGTIITLVARAISTPYTVTVSGGTGPSAITLTRTIQAATANSIPFARVVGQASTMEGGQCRLFAQNDRILGVALATHALEKDRVGPAAVTVWPPNEVVDVIDKSLANDGVWVECVESVATGIALTDAVYIVHTAGADQGKVTKSSSSTTAYTTARFASGVTLDINGKTGVMVYLD